MLRLQSDEISVAFSTLGARLEALRFRGCDVIQGAAGDASVVAGDYTAGAVCGRHAGRIRDAEFQLGAQLVRLVPNMGADQLHGGPDNFALRHWQVEQGEGCVRFMLISPAGDQGFPGEVRASAIYRLKGAVLSLDLEAVTSETTIVNLTNHVYWNLGGGGDVLGHEMMINADFMLPLDQRLLPSGEIKPVDNTEFDFRKTRAIAQSFDTFWQVKGERGQMRQAVVLSEPIFGRRMELWTSETGVQIYTANHWTSQMPGKFQALQAQGAVAIEAQNAPDAIHHANLPSPLLRAGAVYRNRIEWRFS